MVDHDSLNARRLGALFVGITLLAGCEAETTEDPLGHDPAPGATTPGPAMGEEKATPTEDPQDTKPDLMEDAEAEADLEGAEGEEIEGDVHFYVEADGVRMVAEVENAKPGKHGFHIHETGDCSDIKGKSMGGHFAPESKDHALPSEGERHLGDLGNIEIGEDGRGKLDVKLSQATLDKGAELSILGKAVVVHEGEDSGKAKQPSGDSGTPIACGVIEKD